MTPDLSKLSFSEIFELYAQIRQWARKRKFWGQGNIVGSYTEHLVAQSFDLVLAPAANPGFDATDKEGCTYQIKGLFDSKNLWAGWKSEEKLAAFDFLVCVIFNDLGHIKEAYLVPRAVAKDSAVFGAQKMWWIYFRQELWQKPGVEDITERLRKTDVVEIST